MGVVESPSQSELARAVKSNMALAPLQCFVNAQEAERLLGLPVVKGWAVFEHLDWPHGEAFLAERYWWNSLENGEWIDFTPRPREWESKLLLVKANDGAPKAKSTLTLRGAEILYTLLKQRFNLVMTASLGASNHMLSKESRRNQETNAGGSSSSSTLPASMATFKEAATSAATATGAENNEATFEESPTATVVPPPKEQRTHDSPNGDMQTFESWLQMLLQRPPPLLALSDARPTPTARETMVYCAPAPPAQKRVELAGRACRETYESQEQTNTRSPDVASNTSTTAASSTVKQAASLPARGGCKKQSCAGKRRQAASQDAGVPRGRAGGRSGLKASFRGVDLYELLGISVDSPQIEDVRVAYKKLALAHHPDKQPAGSRSVDKKRDAGSKNGFFLIQQAYEYLVDPGNLCTYESMQPFDDSIPTAETAQADGFFNVFGPVFERNAKWSERQPVPLLGQASASPDYVRDFYRFWFDFDSWRDVSKAFQERHGEQLCDLSEVCGRDERRQMQIDNERLRKRFKAAEIHRIQSLVTLARSLDPRLQAQSDLAPARSSAERVEWQSAQAQRELEQQMASEEKCRSPKEDEERRLRQEMRWKLKRQRMQLRAAVREAELRVDEAQLQELVLLLNVEELEELTASIVARGAEASETLLQAMRDHGIRPCGMCTESLEGGDPERSMDMEERARKERNAAHRRQALEEKRRIKAEEAAEEARQQEEFWGRRLDETQCEAKRRAALVALEEAMDLETARRILGEVRARKPIAVVPPGTHRLESASSGPTTEVEMDGLADDAKDFLAGVGTENDVDTP